MQVLRLVLSRRAKARSATVIPGPQKARDRGTLVDTRMTISVMLRSQGQDARNAQPVMR